MEGFVEISTLVLALCFVAYLLWQQHKAGKPLTFATIVAAIEAAKPVAQRVDTVAEGIVLANEQLKREGKLTNHQAFERAFEVIRAEFPLVTSVTDEEIIRAINKYVLLASNMTAQIEQAKRNTP